MKRLLFALMLVVLSFGVVAPAFAMDGCDHDMHGHAPTIAALVEHTTHARTMGHIDNDGVYRSLLSLLNAAQAAQDHGDINAAVGNLNAFIYQVQAQAGKHIMAECAEHLIMHAEQVIPAL